MMGKYRYFGRSKQPYEFKKCPTCGCEAWILKRSTFCSISCSKMKENNHNYRGGVSFKGTLAEYKAFHHQVKRHRGKASSCVIGCVNKTMYHWANLTGKYEDVNDYVSMCVSCHHRFDASKLVVLH